MMRPLHVFLVVLGSAPFLGGEFQSAYAQWDLWDPWNYGSGYQTSYYAPSFFGGYWTGYGASAGCNTCCYGPAPAWDCGCAGACSSCSGGNCASGNCSLNSAPSGSPRPIAEPENNRNRETPVPGRSNSGGRTFDPNDNRNFENPNRTRPNADPDTDNNARPFRSGTGSGTGTGTGTNPGDDGFRPRTNSGTGRGTGSGTGTGTELEGNPDPFQTKKPVNDPDIPEVPARGPAAPADVKEEAPVDADLGLELKMTSRPVMKRERQTLQSRFTTPSIVRTPARSRSDWSATPQDARIARQ